MKWHSRLKQKFVSAPVLAYADFSRPFTLEIATRGWEPSCLRMFTDRGGQLHMKAGRSVEQRGIWKIVAMKLELLGLKCALTDKFQEHCISKKFAILTNNNLLSHLQTAKLGAVEQRWVSELARFH